MGFLCFEAGFIFFEVISYLIISHQKSSSIIHFWIHYLMVFMHSKMYKYHVIHLILLMKQYYHVGVVKFIEDFFRHEVENVAVAVDLIIFFVEYFVVVMLKK